MGIISKLKSVFGLRDGDGGRRSSAGTTVTVEREPAAPGERAVKGVPPSAGVDDGEPSDDGKEPASTPGDSSVSPGEPVDSIKGIGPAYADRLAEAGVNSIADLAEADAEELASATGLGTGRVGNWIERARARTR